MNDFKALRLLGLALRSGRLEVGAENAAALAASGRARLVVTAALGRAECAAAATADPGFSKAIAQSISNGGGNSIEHHS